MSLLELLAPLFPDLDRPLDYEDSPDTIDGWDSFKQVEIVLQLEDELGVRLSTAEISEMSSVSAMARVLDRLGVEVKLT